MAQIYDPYGYDYQRGYAEKEAYMRQMQNEQARAMGYLQQQGLANAIQAPRPVSQPEPNKVLLLLE